MPVDVYDAAMRTLMATIDVGREYKLVLIELKALEYSHLLEVAYRDRLLDLEHLSYYNTLIQVINAWTQTVAMSLRRINRSMA